MASIEAQIAIILKGTAELDKLQSKLDKMYGTIEEIAGKAIGAGIEGSEDVTKYSNALKKVNIECEKLNGQLEAQAAATNKSNAKIKETIRLESQLRRERSLVSRFTREFKIETKGLNQAEGQLKDIKDRFDNLSGAFSKAFKLGDTGLVRDLRNELRSLVQEQRDWNRTLTGTKKTGVNADFLQEQARGYKEQIDALRARAGVLKENEDIIRKLNAAERNLVTGRSKEGTFLNFADPRLGREQLANMTKLVNLRERRARASSQTGKENERLSSAAAALEKQRHSALEKISQVEEKIKSSKRISAKEAQDYYFQAQLPRLALPFGEAGRSAIQGGARRTGPSVIQGRAEPRIREILGGARTAEEAGTTFKLIEEKGIKVAKSIKESFADAYKAILPPDTLLSGLEALGKVGKIIAKAAEPRKETLADREKLSSAAAALEKQRQSALEKISQVEEKIRSSKKISAKEARDYYFQAQLPRLALPFGDTNQPSMQGGARRGGSAREILGGGRSANEAEATFRLIEEKSKKTAKVVKQSFADAYKAALPPGALSSLTALEKVGKALSSTKGSSAAEQGKQRKELDSLRQALSAMEGRRYNPFGISNKQVNAGLDERASQLQKILQIEEKIRSSKRISIKEAREYYSQAQLPQPALPFGDVNQSAIRGGARRGGSAREFLGGGRSAEEAEKTFRLIEEKSKKTSKVIEKNFADAYKAMLPPGTVLTELAALGEVGKIIKKAAEPRKETLADRERLSSAAVALEKQRQSALEKILQVEEKIRSSRKISAKEAQDYYFQAQLPRLALPFGDASQPAMRGGARNVGPSIIQGQAAPRIKEILGGSRSANEAEDALRLIQDKGVKAGKAVKESFADAYKAMLPPDTVLTGLAALGKIGQTLASTKVRGGGQSGLEEAIGSLQEARGARERFLGGVSPAEAVNNIVREFNTGKPMVGGRSDLASRAAAAAQQGPQALLGLAELAKPAKVSTAELEALSAVLKEFRSVLDPTIQGFDRLDNQLRETAANLDRRIERRATDADFLTRQFGPRGGSAISEGLIGGAFPLLFGQGLGASIGGLVGGASGGFLGGGLGFGLSLAGTALGTVFDTLAQAVQDTGKAFGYPIEGFESLKTAGLLASRQQEYYISKLIETGETAKATAEIQAEMIKKIGVSGVNDLMDLGDASFKLSKSWAEFNLQLQAALAGPMAGLLQWITSILEVSNKNDREEAKRRNSFIGLSDADKTAANKKISREILARGGPDAVGLQGIQDIRARVLGEFSARSNPVKAQTGRLTPEQKLQELDKAIEKTEKARSIIQQGIAYERSGIDHRLSTEETVYGLRKRAIGMEREATEFRRSVEDQVFGKRQELEQKLIENEKKRQQNAIDAFDLQLQKASTGLDPIAQGVVDAARNYLRVRAEGEANLQQAEKQLKLELQKIDQEVSRYKLQVEDRVSQIAIQRDEFSRDVSRARLQIERQIVDYAVQAENHRLAMAKYRYEVEIDLERKKQIVVQNGLEDAAIQASAIRQAVQATNGTGVSRLPGSISGRLDASGQNGADMPVALNNIMRSYHNGIVTEINKAGNNGNYVVVQFLDDLGNKLEATYSHVAAAVKVGQSVVGGQTIGRFDASGRTFGAHNSIDINSPGTNGALQRNRETAAARRSADMLVRGRVQGVVSGIKSDTDTYLQPGVGYFSRKTGRMVKGLTTGAGQTTPVGASPQAAMGVASTVGAAPVFKGTMTMPELPGAPRLVGINDLLQQYFQLVEKIKTATVGATAADKQRFAVQSEAARFALEQQTLAPILQYTEQNRELEFEIQKRKERNRLALEGVAPEIIEGELRILEIRRDLNSVLTGLDIAAGKVAKSELERLKINPELVDSTFALTEATLASLVATTADTKEQEKLRAKLQAILDLKNQARGQAVTAVEGARGVAKESVMSPSEKIEGGIDKLKQELAELTNVGNMAITVADGIGSAFGRAFQGLISGSMSAQEALSSFFKGVADTFLSMAAEIMAKQMALITLQMIAKALGLFAGSGGGGGASTPWPSSLEFNPNAFSMPALAANGAYFTSGTAAFANGGAFTNSIVSSPTLFQFSDSGAAKMGEMGEAGPEAIMPLSRDSRGRLGVRASGLSVPFAGSNRPSTTDGDSSGAVPFLRETGALKVPFLRNDSATAGDQGFQGAIDVRFETVRVGSLDVVTREEAEQIGRKSAQRGADLAHKRFRDNPSARRAAGIS